MNLFIKKVGLLLGVIPIVFSAKVSAQDVLVDGSTLSDSFTLTDQITSPVYEDRQVASTCYRRDIIGYHQECRTEYTQSCYTDYKTVCRNRYQTVCGPKKVCRTVPKQVCRVNPNGTRRCRTEYRQQCSYTNQCHQKPVRSCKQVAYQKCDQVPKQVCEQVADYGDVPYSCTKTQSVYVGDRVDFDVTANVELNYTVLPSSNTPSEELSLSINKDLVSLEIDRDSKDFLILQTDRKEKVKFPSSKSKNLEISYDLSFYDLQEAIIPYQRGVKDITMDRYQIQFKLGKVAYTELNRFSVSIFKSNGSSWDGVYTGTPGPLALTKTSHSSLDDLVTVELSEVDLPFGKGISLGSGTYLVRIYANIKKSDILNQKTLKKFKTRTVEETTLFIP